MWLQLHLFRHFLVCIIFHYRIRVDFLDTADSTKGEFWVTQSLPNTLMPFGGYEPLNGAVLECNYFNTGMSYKATSIKHTTD